MLRTKLFQGFVLLVLFFSLLSALFGIRVIQQRVIAEAQTRVTLDLSSAWALFGSKLHEIEVVVRLAANKEAVLDMCQAADWQNADVAGRLERLRLAFNLDFLDVLDADGRVALRTTPPYARGDLKISDPAVAAALRGEARSCVALLPRAELEREAEGLADRAFLELEATPRSRPSPRRIETRGMAMVAAVPVRQGSQIVGIVYGGLLLNRNHELVDRIRDVVFKNEEYRGAPVGTATMFLGDARIATTVRLKNGNRALGTRVSKEVADRVLDNGLPWIGDAFVVDQWYLSAYEPIRDGRDLIVGMLYVGILKKPFQEYARAIVTRYVYVSLLAVAVALALAFVIANRLSMPIHRLVEASNRFADGERTPPLPLDRSCHETEMLIRAFNDMTATLAEREDRLKALNRSYMETLGFVSHELKSPVATMMNYVFLLREGKLGPLTEKQAKAVKAIDSNCNRLVEMARHYLNLSRIENHDLQPVRTRVDVRRDVLQPLLHAMEADLEARRLRVFNEVAEDVALEADMNMVREVFENLVSNAVKYGREGGSLRLRAAAENGSVRFFVWNDGLGIPADKLGSLFQKFVRLNDTEAARRQKGTGLGLFIAKSIVEAHGGEISASSRAGEWVEFTFTLPRFTGTNQEQPNAKTTG